MYVKTLETSERLQYLSYHNAPENILHTFLVGGKSPFPPACHGRVCRRRPFVFRRGASVLVQQADQEEPPPAVSAGVAHELWVDVDGHLVHVHRLLAARARLAAQVAPVVGRGLSQGKHDR